MVALVAASTVVRWWCVATLGKHWNPRLIVDPRAPRWFAAARTGGCTTRTTPRSPWRWSALPLVHSAWLTAIVFTIANALVLRVRIRSENLALGYA